MTEVIRGYAHDALFYGSDEEMVTTAAPFLRAALDGPEVPMLACTDRNASLLADALHRNPRLGVLDRSTFYRRVPATIAAYQQMTESYIAAGAERVRVVGEIDFDRHDWAEWTRFEALSNTVLEPYPLWTLCLYDTRRLRAEVLEAAKRTHPYLIMGTDRTPNPHYVNPDRFLSQFAPAHPDPVEMTAPAIDVSGTIDLPRLREDVRGLFAGSAARPETVDGFVFAVSEATTNAVTHGWPPVRVRVWSTRDRSVCTVLDHGGGLDDPLTGYAPAGNGGPGAAGRGLWMARQLCDVVSASRADGAFTVRIISLHR